METPISKVSLEAEWASYASADRNVWIGICDSLGISVESSSESELEEDMRDAIILLLDDLRKTGELEKVARQKRWIVERSQHAPVQQLPVQRVMLDVPKFQSLTPRPGRKVWFDVPFTPELGQPEKVVG